MMQSILFMCVTEGEVRRGMMYEHPTGTDFGGAAAALTSSAWPPKHSCIWDWGLGVKYLSASFREVYC